MILSTKYGDVLGYMAKHYGGSVKPKRSSRLMKTIDVVLRIITFGLMRSFMTSFVTTIGATVYVPDGWDKRDSKLRAVTLRHEMVHMEQERRYGSLLFRLLYLFVLPGGLAFYRAKFEKEAYTESLRGLVQVYGVRVLDNDEYRDYVLHHFTSAEYFWMWPFRKSLLRWYAGVVQQLREELRDGRLTLLVD